MSVPKDDEILLLGEWLEERMVQLAESREVLVQDLSYPNKIERETITYVNPRALVALLKEYDEYIQTKIRL